MPKPKVLSETIGVPVRVSCSDDPLALLSRAMDWKRQGHDVAVVTLVEIRGGAARALGAQMIVRGDAAYSGYISGGCTEAAVAADAVAAIRNGSDRFLRLGEGSPFFDIVLPCGGGITLAIHLLRNSIELETLIEQVTVQRRRMSMIYDPGAQSFKCLSSFGSTEWLEDKFVIAYRPKLKLLVAGGTQESEICARIARAAEYEVSLVSQRGQMCWRFDADTAVALLYHDLDRELPLLRTALASDCFYIGALGSSRTHSRRTKVLHDLGFDAKAIDRIRAPIGLIPKARDASVLAISIIAEVVSAYASSE